MTLERIPEIPRPIGIHGVPDVVNYLGGLATTLQDHMSMRPEDFQGMISTLDHGNLSGLTDDDHIAYLRGKDIRQYADFATAISSIGATPTTLWITSETAVPDDATVPATMTLKFVRGGSLNIATTKTVTINGGVDAGLYQVFQWTGTGKVAFGAGAVKEVYPQWWGAKGDGVTDDTAAIQAAINSGAKLIRFPASTYLANITAKASVTLVGDGISATYLQAFSANVVISNNSGAIDAAFFSIKDMQIVGHTTFSGYTVDLRGSGVSPFTGPRYSLFENLYIHNTAAGKGIQIERCWNTTFRKVRTNTFGTAVSVLNGCNVITFEDCVLGGGSNPAAASLTDAVVRLFGSAIEHTSIAFHGCSIENGYAQAMYALAVQGLSVESCCFGNEVTTVASADIQIEQCPSARFIGNRVRVRTSASDFVLDNTSSTTKVFREGNVTVENNVFASDTHTYGAFSAIGSTASTTTAKISNNSTNWFMFGSRYAGIGRVPHQRYSQSVLVMPQHDARYSSPGSTAIMPVNFIEDGWYLSKAEWVCDTTYTGGTANTLYLEKRHAVVFTAAVTDICTLATTISPFYMTAYKVQLTTTDTLPAGLALATNYYIIPTGANTFKIATSAANANAGTVIDITDTGTGTHTVTIYGLVSSGSSATTTAATAGDRVNVALLSDATTPSYKTGILSQGEYLYGYSGGGGTVNEYGHWEVTLSRFQVR